MINLSEQVRLDIDSQKSSLIPLIVINTDPKIYISTNKGIFDGDIFWEDYNLSVSTLSDSINIKSKNFQVNKISFTLSNYKVGGKRFSDFIYERGLLNKTSEVYYRTQSCTEISQCILVFKGKIKSLDHDSKKCRIQIEDLTEDKLNKQIPIANLGYSNNVYSEEYLNRPIPMVYGEVDKAPAVPFVDRTNANDSLSFRIIADAISEVVETDRDIQIGGFHSSGNELITSLSTLQNPLYIHKDSYFQVLHEYDSDVLSGGEDAQEWDWDQKEQYTTNNGYIEIRKMFQGVIPLNPPAFNELQCTKVRFPKQLLLQSNEDEDQEQDNNNYTYLNIEEEVLDPELSCDNQLTMSHSTNINPGKFYSEYGNYYDTFAQIPNNLIEEELETPIYDGVRMHQYSGNTEGILCFDSNSITWGHKMLQWLYFYSYSLNDEGFENPKVVFKQFPSYIGLKERLRQEVNQELANIGYIPQDQITIYNPFTSGKSITPHYDQENSQYTAQIGLGSNYSGGVPSDSATDMGWFEQAHEDLDSADGVPVPQPFWHHQTIKSDLIEVLGYAFAAVTLDNGTINMQDSLPSEGQAKTWNLFNLNDDNPFLFNTEQFAEYVPLDISLSYQPQERLHYRSFKAAKINETTVGSGMFTEGHDYSSSGTWFGRYGFNANGWNACRTRNNDMFYDGPRSWVVWVKQDLPNAGYAHDYMDDYGCSIHNPFANDDYSGARGKFKFNANTVFPISHRATRSSNAGSGAHEKVYYGSGGVLENTDQDHFKIHYKDTTLGLPDTRLSLVFPFGDLDISDDIHTDTFFHGKVKCKFSDDTDDTTQHDFILSVAPIEQEHDLSYIDGEISKTLISESLSGCKNNEHWWSSDPRDYPIENSDNEIILNQENTHYTETNGLLRIDYFDTATYTSLNMTYRIESIIESNKKDAILNTDIHNVGLLHYIVFESALESDFYLNVLGRVSSTIGDLGETLHNVVETPQDIIEHFLINELMFDSDIIDASDRDDSIHSGDRYGFSVKDLTKAKSFIQDFSKDTRLFPKFKANGLFSFSYIRDTYGDEDVLMTIKSSDIIKYKWKRTPIQDINTIVNVKYKIDYADDDFTRETGYLDGYDMFGNGDGIEEMPGLVNGYSYNYLGLEREDKVLEYESKFIRDRITANKLRDFLYMFNCNQHNLVNLDLPIKYINLEAGDIINFDGLIDDLNAYGENYTQVITRNGQAIYPYFIITKIQKKINGISLEAMQLHDLTSKFDPAIGSITRMIPSGEETFAFFSDFLELEDYFAGGNKYFTNKQKSAADIDQNGILNALDLDNMLGLQNYVGSNDLGDLNADGIVNVMDIVALIGNIISGDGSDATDIMLGDINEDGILNVIDIVAIVNIIIGDSLEGTIPGNNFGDDVGFDEFGDPVGPAIGDEDETGGESYGQ